MSPLLRLRFVADIANLKDAGRDAGATLNSQIYYSQAVWEEHY